MAFPDQIARPFSQAGIDEIPDTAHGVYGLYRQNAWIYVGKGNIKVRLKRHLAGDNACITREAPTWFVIDTATPYVDEREKELILELNSVCNERVG